MPSQERRKRTNANKKTDDDGHLDAAPAQALSNGGGKGAARSTTTTTGKKEGLKSTLRIVSALLSLLCFSYVLYQRFYASPSPASVLETKQGRTYGTAPFAIEPAPVLAREEVDFGEDKEKKEAIVEAFTHSWKAYVRDAWGSDEYSPLSRSGTNLSESGGVGYTIVDALDTLLLMGLDEDYNRARDWVRDELTFERPGRFSVFETTIRTFGGLLSAYALSSSSEDRELFLSKAVDLADRLVPAFDTPTGIPRSFIDLQTGHASGDKDNGNASSLAEATTVQLEFKYLAHLTHDRSYWRLAEKPMSVAKNAKGVQDGLLPIFLNPENGQFYMTEIRLGSRGDSYYEYLLKQWLQTNRAEQVYRDMYDEAMGGIKRHLLKRSSKSGMLYTAELHPRMDPRSGRRTLQLVPKQDHLVCFLGGSLMLGATSAQAPLPPSDLRTRGAAAEEDWNAGAGLTKTCVDTYINTTTGLAPEIVFFRMPGEKESKDEDWFVKKSPPGQKSVPLIDARNILRPETVESLFIAYHLSGDPIYREWGWEIFQAFQKYCRVPSGGFASIDDVNAEIPKQQDRMETFWLSETLKYLFLLFSDRSVLPLDKWVLNTEAHPLPVFDPIWPTTV